MVIMIEINEEKKTERNKEKPKRVNHVFVGTNTLKLIL